MADYPVITFRKEVQFVVDGHVYSFDHDVELAIRPNESEYPRVDAIVVRPGYAGVVYGTPGHGAPEPLRPDATVVLTIKVPPCLCPTYVPAAHPDS